MIKQSISPNQMNHLLSRMFILLFILLSGCKLGPNYHRPSLDIPDKFHYETADSKDSLNLMWWEQFQDDVLESLITESLANNKNIQIAAANIEQAIGVLIQIRAQLFPQIGYDGTFTRFRSSTTLPGISLPAPLSIPNPTTTWEAVLTGSWQIDVWGRTRRQVEAAVANINATYEARQGVILSVVSSLADSYIQLRGLDEQLVISERTMNSYQDAVIYFQNQFKYGQASQMLVAQALTQYEIAASKIPQLKSQIAQLENSICVLLGRNPGPIERGKTIYDLQIPMIPADLPSELLCQRPDIMQAEQELIAANAQIGAAIALYFPAISLTGNFGNASKALHELFTGPSTTWGLVGSIVGPIFTAGAVYGQVVQAESQDVAATILYAETVQNAFAEVESALVAHTMLVEQLAALERLVAAAGDYQRLAELQYKGGYSPYYVVIQAQQQYFPAQLSWAQARAQLFSSVVNIYQSMGGGWVVSAEGLTGADYEYIPVPPITF